VPSATPLTDFSAARELLVEGTDIREKGLFLSADDAVFRLRRSFDQKELAIPWARIRRIGRREGPERRSGIPVLLALLFGGALGACGLLLDLLAQSSSGNASLIGRILGFLTGAAIGALLGSLIMFAFPGPYWVILFELPVGLNPPAEPLDNRLQRGQAMARESEQKAIERRDSKLWMARVALLLLAIVLLGVWASF
jgi:hypothetical protein